jgi:hypothetical protein
VKARVRMDLCDRRTASGTLSFGRLLQPLFQALCVENMPRVAIKLTNLLVRPVLFKTDHALVRIALRLTVGFSFETAQNFTSDREAG